MTETQERTPQPETKLIGLVAEFASDTALLSAAAKAREEGYQKTEAYTPFPIHGLDEAMGIRPTILPWIVLGCGLSGGTIGLVGQWWMNAVDYPFWISGKPLFSLPANIPVIFELIILISALGAIFGMLALNQLPRLSNPLFRSKRFLRATNDLFFFTVEADDPKFDIDATRSFLESVGAANVEVCESEVGGGGIPKITYAAIAITVCLALIPPAMIARARVTTSDKPRWHTFIDMDYQPRFRPQTMASMTLFDDRRADRSQIAGTVARGQLYLDSRLYRGIEPDAEAVETPAGAKTAAEGTAADEEASATETDAAEVVAEEAVVAEETAVIAEEAEIAAEEAEAAVPPAVEEEPQPNWVTSIPLPITTDLMERGRQRFNIYCATCHGRVGDGDGLVSKRALGLEQGTWIPPLSLHNETVINQPVGRLYNTITNGIRKMPSYGDQISVEDRWAIVLYIRALQRSRNASPADVPADKIDSLRDL